MNSDLVVLISSGARDYDAGPVRFLRGSAQDYFLSSVNG